MSAANKHLEWFEMSDFKPGLVTVGGDMLAPPTGASQMDDVLVSPPGGLRAAMRPVSYPTTGIANSGTVTIHGLFIRGGIGPTASDTDRFLWVKDADDLKVYRFDESVDNTWHSIGTIPLGGSGPNGVVADTFVDSNDDEYIVFNLFQSAANDGLWSINRGTGQVLNRLSGPTTCCVVQDNIIIAARGAELRWSAPQSISSWPSENNMLVQASRRGSLTVTMNAFAPSDLLLGQQLAPWVLIQGDITQPLVRNMSNARIPKGIQRTPLTSGGVAFLGFGQGIFLTSDGQTFNDISQAISAKTWGFSPAPIGYSGEFLLVGPGKGLIYDERTGAWHHTTAITATNTLSAGDIGQSEIFSVTSTGGVMSMWTFKTSLTDRAGSWTWKSVPLHSDAGRQIVIREVQVYAESFDSNATVAVTVGGVTHSVTIASASKQQLSYRFLARDETLDVKVVCTAGTSASNEAPSVEAVRIGHQPGHQLLQ